MSAVSGGETAREAKKRMTRESTSVGVSRGSAASRGSNGEIFESELLPAFDRAIAAATQNAKMNPEDKHQMWALRKGKAAVLESLKQGNDISIGAIHTLTGVGHWVVQQVKDHLPGGSAMQGGSDQPAAKRARPGAAPPATPSNFTWWYLDRNGKYVKDLNSAEANGPLGMQQYRVMLQHSSSRMEKAWLPESKCPPCSPGAPLNADPPPLPKQRKRPEAVSDENSRPVAPNETGLDAADLRRRRLARFG